MTAKLVPGERSKYAVVTEPGRDVEAFFLLNKTFDNLPE